MITRRSDVALMALTADCPLLVVVDPSSHCLGVAHCGWRGTVANMPARLVERLADSFDFKRDNALAVVAPAAGPCCYEIRNDVIEQVISAGGDTGRHLHWRAGRCFLDLSLLIADQLVGAGLASARIHLADTCTICDRRFWSYRRLGPDTGHAALIARMRIN